MSIRVRKPDSPTGISLMVRHFSKAPMPVISSSEPFTVTRAPSFRAAARADSLSPQGE